jgi:molybdopterin converting factor small subunit
LNGRPMKIRLDISMLPPLAEALGRKTMDVDMDGASVGDLVRHLVGRHGKKAREALFDEGGEIDPVIKVIVNDEKFLVREQFDAAALVDGDRVKFMVFVAGG